MLVSVCGIHTLTNINQINETVMDNNLVQQVDPSYWIINTSFCSGQPQFKIDVLKVTQLDLILNDEFDMHNITCKFEIILPSKLFAPPWTLWYRYLHLIVKRINVSNQSDKLIENGEDSMHSESDRNNINTSSWHENGTTGGFNLFFEAKIPQDDERIDENIFDDCYLSENEGVIKTHQSMDVVFKSEGKTVVERIVMTFQMVNGSIFYHLPITQLSDTLGK